MKGGPVPFRLLPLRAAAAAALMLAAAGLKPAAGGDDLGLALEIEHASLLLFEPLHAFVRIENRTGDGFIAGDQDSGLAFTIRPVVERMPDGDVPLRESRPRLEDVALIGGRAETMHFDLTRWYDLARTGKYAVWFEVVWRSKVYRSNKIVFDVVRGIELQRMTRTVPGYSDLQWTYTLRYWARPHNGRSAEFLFLSVDDPAKGLNYGVFQLGRLVRVSTPGMTIDPYGIVSVAHQVGPDCFARSTLSASGAGVYFVDQTYHLPDGAPYPSMEQKEAGGKILVNPAPAEEEFFLKRWWRNRFGRSRNEPKGVMQ